MEAHLLNWIALLLRWGHFITGVAWIGASFYFNWLENHLERKNTPEGVSGDLWAVHGGGFYYLTKFAVAPGKMPAHLHWFKWEAYATWLSGFALLIVVFYWNARLYLLEPGAGIAPHSGILIGLSALLGSWLFYDGLCRSPLAGKQAVMGFVLLAWFAGLAWLLGQFFNPRATYVHVGAAIGTVMVANVFRVIIPAQRELVEALKQNRPPDSRPGLAALQRSRHNNYFTLPVLFIMISSHYPMTYGHPRGWLILTVISVAGVLIRHFFNIRHLPGKPYAALLAGLALLVALVFLTRPEALQAPAVESPVVSIEKAWSIVQKRCMTCHARGPGNVAFTSAPLGIELDSVDGLRLNAERVYQTVVITRTMPLENLTQMTDTERSEIARWFESSDPDSGN